MFAFAWFGCRLPRQASPATPSEKGNIRGVADRTGCSAPSPMPSHSGRGVARGWGVRRPHPCPPIVGEGVAKGCSAPSHIPSHSGRGVAKGWGIWRPHPCPLIAGEGWPRMGSIPLFRGVADRTGAFTSAPMPSHSGRGVAKGWGVFPSLEGWPTGRGVHFRSHALS